MAIICCHCTNSIQTATKKRELAKKNVHNGDNKKKTHLIEKLTVCSGVNTAQPTCAQQSSRRGAFPSLLY